MRPGAPATPKTAAWYSPQVFVPLDDLFETVDGKGQGLSHRNAAPSQSDAGLKQVLPRQPAVPPVGQLVTPDLPRYGYGQPTCPKETQHRFNLNQVATQPRMGALTLFF